MRPSYETDYPILLYVAADCVSIDARHEDPYGRNCVIDADDHLRRRCHHHQHHQHRYHRQYLHALDLYHSMNYGLHSYVADTFQDYRSMISMVHRHQNWLRHPMLNNRNHSNQRLLHTIVFDVVVVLMVYIDDDDDDDPIPFGRYYSIDLNDVAVVYYGGGMIVVDVGSGGRCCYYYHLYDAMAIDFDRIKASSVKLADVWNLASMAAIAQGANRRR